MTSPKEIWILGALGRSGRAVAAYLAARQLPLVLVGRNAPALRDLAATLGGTARAVAADSIPAMAKELVAQAAGRPLVVFNAIGPFAQTALPVIRACPPGSGYLDLSNELPAIIDVLGLHDEAVASGSCWVAGAGWGVLACESIVLKLCENQPPAKAVRVDSLPYVNSPPGPVGRTLAATIIESIPAGVRMYRDGVLVSAALGGEAEALTLPDGSTARTGNVGLGDVEAARRASNASSVLAASSVAPTGTAARLLMPLLLTLMSVKAVRDFSIGQIAKQQIKAKEPTQQNSWARARVTWPDGQMRQGWLRVGDAGVFTEKVAAEVAARLAQEGGGRPGAYTPGALFGADLAVTLGGTFILDT